MKYSKQPLTIEQQISLLKDRGLVITDENAAQTVLGSISYFRLANYFRPMETDKQSHQFKPGATFENAVRLYDFDASLRELLFKAIARIEIALRTKMIHNFSDTKVKKNIARSFNLPQHKVLESWTACLAALRNGCAHHARMWNRNYPVTPAIPAKLKDAWISNTTAADNKLYIQLCCIAYLLNNIHPGNTFTQALKGLIAAYPNVDVAAMGFPSDWRTEALWQ